MQGTGQALRAVPDVIELTALGMTSSRRQRCPIPLNRLDARLLVKAGDIDAVGMQRLGSSVQRADCADPFGKVIPIVNVRMLPVLTLMGLERSRVLKSDGRASGRWLARCLWLTRHGSVYRRSSG